MVRELRAAGKSEWTIAGVLKAANRVFKFANRRMGWYGTNPVGQLEDGERPKLSAGPKRRIYTRDELQQTLAAATEPWYTLFAFAAVTGARLSECLGLVWSDLELGRRDHRYGQLRVPGRPGGRRQPLKTDESRRTIELPRRLATMLVEHKRRRSIRDPTTSSSPPARAAARAAQRARALCAARRSSPTSAVGRPSRCSTSATSASGSSPRPGTLPTFHPFRHTAASHAIAAGESAEEVSWQLGHRNSVVTRAVYIHEIKTAERKRRSGGSGWRLSHPCS